MNIAIVGYGRMGRQIEKIVIEKKHSVKSIIDNYIEDSQYKALDSNSLKDIDVAIDFTHPETVIENIKAFVDNNVNVVLGTTGWYDKIDEVKKIINNKIGLIWSGNFSLGVNIFFRIVKQSAKIFNKFKEYDSMLYEIHHKMKKDSPSGTAKMLGNILIEELSNKEKSVEEKLDRKIEDNEIHFASIRGGSVPGTHVVMFDSPVDSIELKHTARNRQGFASGAVLAAEWIHNKKGFFDINDLMDSMI